MSEPEAEAEPEAEPEMAPEADAEAAPEPEAEEAALEAEAAPEPEAEAEADAVFEGTEDEVAASTKIQAMHRGKASRKAKLLAEKEAGEEVTAEEKEAVATVVPEAEAAAMKAMFEAATAGEDGKVKVADLLTALAENTEEWAAAWKEMLFEEEADAALNLEDFTVMRGRTLAFTAEEADTVFEGTEEEIAAAAKIQSLHRGKIARQDLEDQKAAAVKIQAIQRGKKTRKSAATAKETKAHIAKAEPKDLLKLIFESIDTDADGICSAAELSASAFGGALAAEKWSADSFNAFLAGEAPAAAEAEAKPEAGVEAEPETEADAEAEPEAESEAEAEPEAEAEAEPEAEAEAEAEGEAQAEGEAEPVPVAEAGKFTLDGWQAFFETFPADKLKMNLVLAAFKAEVDVTALVGELVPAAAAQTAEPEPEVELSTTLPVLVNDALVEWNEDKSDFTYHKDKVKAIRLQAVQEAKENPKDKGPTPLEQIVHSFGFEGSKRGNLRVLGGNTILTAAGNMAVLLDIQTMQKTYLNGIAGKGVGALAVHPSGNYFAVGEKGDWPDIIIYEFPSLKVKRILRRGAEKGYSSLAFNIEGERLASVGMAPDYLLTIWQWQTEAVLLKNKAFSQDIFNAEFSPYQKGEIVTSGVGHIRFWKMANTFTGMKLQGAIGKFGKVELSDVAAFCEFSDGLKLCGTETGQLLVWDGEFVKCQLSQEGGAPCHQGRIEVCYNDGTEVVTAGTDGYIRVWDMKTMNEADLADDATEFYVVIEPLREIFVGDDVAITTLCKRENDWLVQDINGSVWKVSMDGSYSPIRLLSFHSGSVAGVVASTTAPSFVTAGADSSVRFFDYEKRRELHQVKFSAPCTKLQQIPVTLDTSKGGSVAVGFADGVVRFLAVTSDDFKLLSVCKPHADAVTAIEVSPDGKQIATAGSDGCVFFFKATKGEGTASAEITPIGFFVPTENSSPVNFLSWCPNSRKILISCHDGSVVEAISPGAGDYDNTVFDTSKSFQIELTKKNYEFQRPVVAGPEPEAEPEPEPEDGAIPDEEVEEEEVIVLPPEPALSAMYVGELGNFLLTLDGVDSGHIYECSFDIGFPLRDIETDGSVVTSMRYSTSRDFILAGCRGGIIEILPADLDGPAWRSTMHDGFYGDIKGVATSFDERFLISSGADENIFIVDMSFAEMERAKIQQVQMLTEDIVPAPAVLPKDITEAGAYSIEEEKLKAEHDAEVAKAEASKDNVRQYLEQLRSEFNELKGKNGELAPSAQLTEAEFDLDPELGAVLEAERQAKLDSADAEMAWDRERTQRHLEKLNKRYIDMMVVDGIELIGFRNEHSITSFKVTKLPAEMEETLTATIEEADAGDVVATSQEETAVAEGEEAVAEGEEPITEGGETAKIETAENENKHEMRKEARLARKAEKGALMSERPDDSYENPEDVAAITWAKQNMGDFKLKTDSDYVVPEAQRVNAEKKRREMVLLETSVYKIKMGFNERFLALRDLKKRIVMSVQDDANDVAAIESELADGEELEGELAKLELDYTEFPEERINAASGEAVEDVAEAADAPAETDDEDMDIPEIEESELEQLEAIARQKSMLYERSAIIKRVEQSIVAFDTALDELRRERFTLAADLKTTEMKLLLLYQELKLLKDFELRELVLTNKLVAKQNDRNSALVAMEECQGKLEENKVKVEELLKVDGQIMKEFKEALGENNPFYEQLFKTFKRKIKRVKPKENSGSGDEDEESESESESDFDDDSDEEEAEEDVCPQGCSQDLFDKVCALRERRLDQEELSAEYQKTIAALKKENDAHVKREAGINTALGQIHKEIQEFQSEKQSKLNELDMVVTLKMHQIQYMNAEKTGLPPATTVEEGAASLESAVVMSNRQLELLAKRIVDLGEEKKGLKRRQKEIRRDNKGVSKLIQEQHDEIEILQGKMREVQMLKFGQEVDLDALSKRSVNKTAEMLEVKCRKIELRQMRELSHAQETIRGAQFELSDVTKENTMRLARLADLTADQHRLEMSLNATQGQLAGGESTMGLGMDEEEKQRLVQLVRLQEREINALKAEINLLRMKGGHVYTPAN